MTEINGTGSGKSDATNWARPVDRLSAAGVAGAKDDAVTGKRVSGPLQGFGPLWQKTFTVRLDGIDTTPEGVCRIVPEITIWATLVAEFFNTEAALPGSSIAVGRTGSALSWV